MTGSDAKMALVLVASLALSAVTLFVTRRHDASAPPLRTAASAPAQLVDATGAIVRMRRFERIASSSILADRLLLELAEPERIVGLSRHGFSGSSVKHLYGRRAPIDPNGDIEALLTLRPDLLLVNNFADRKRIERLRDAGVVVFELGPMRGIDTLVDQIDKTAALLGHPERGHVLAHDFVAKMRAAAVDIPISQRKRGIYIGVHGTQLYGGARGTSYDDELVHAGLIDIAAERYADWPAYTSEQILALDPEVVVTSTGQRDVLCHNAALAQLRACGAAGHVVEIDPERLVDPGLTMLDVTLRIREAVYGPVPERVR